MRKSDVVIFVAIICLLAILYLGPIGYILFVPARGLTQEAQSRPSTTQVEELLSIQSGILIRAREFEAAQVSNKPFPTVITGTSPGSLPSIPSPRIRTAISDRRDWYTTILTIVYFPIGILAGGGPVLFGILAIPILAGAFRPLVTWRRIPGFLAWASLGITLIAITYFLAIWPRVTREYYAEHRPLVWEGSLLTKYLEGGFSVDPNSRDQPTRTRLVVVNGTASSVQLYADGIRVDKVPAQGIRGYRQLREFSRLTTVSISTKTLVDDLYVLESGERSGILIYNVHGADNLRIEGPPTYR